MKHSHSKLQAAYLSLIPPYNEGLFVWKKRTLAPGQILVALVIHLILFYRKKRKKNKKMQMKKK